ncbi:hypothetical protein BT63DRAFT_481855 [Microthyrium microscopicum]|uniref:Galactose oxidase n=1 Tax=Microthyrium microscopicum TaxID=703497 RepID=A0A6A6U158_9PEZI|nr:hypothetical protein BT63DRAFT_481855 [Microthyrium microscopicum]
MQPSTPQQWASVLQFLLFVQTAQAQYDPVVNFCKRLDHQSTVVNGKLYIDGGRQVYTNYAPNGSDIGPHTIGPNEYLLSIDLTRGWDANEGLPITKTPKNLTTPYLTRGALFPSSTNPDGFYLFGGTVASDNTSFVNYQSPQTEGKPIWGYAGSTSGIWNSIDGSFPRPCSGANAVLNDKSKAFWFNGEQDNGSSTTAQSLADTTKFLDGMLVMDLKDASVKSVSTKAVSSNARVRAGMVHVPLEKTAGVLVLLAGGEKPSSDNAHDWKGTLVNLNSVDVFDAGSISDSNPDGQWYSQPTTGTTPSPRVDPCVVAMAAPDISSYNIYMYGGRDGLNAYYDELWILSLPSFQWVRAYSGSSPRYSMTCHAIGRQMIVVGGSNTSHVTDNCDAATQGVKVLDLTALTWSTVFDPRAAAYQVPSQLVKLIGGTGTGGANINAPAAGFAQKGLQALFYPPSSNSTMTPAAGSGATKDDKTKTPVGVIVGIVIAVLVILGLIGALVFLCMRRRRQQAFCLKDDQKVGGSESHLMSGSELHEIPGSTPPAYAKFAEVEVLELPGSDGVKNELPGSEGFKNELAGSSPVLVELEAEKVSRPTEHSRT